MRAGIVEDEVAALVGRGAAREADGRHRRVEPDAAAGGDQVEQLGLQVLAGLPEPFRRSARLAHAGVLPGRDVYPVGDRDDLARALDVVPHGARHLGVELGDGVRATGQAQAGDRHVEGIAADLLHLPVDQLAAGAEPAQLGDRVHLVPGGHRGVRGEDDLLAYRAPGLGERRARGHALGDQLDTGEDGVALVEVIGGDLDAELAQRAHTADPEQDLLRHPAVEAGIVEPVRDPGVARRHRLEQEERRVAPAFRAPDPRLHLARGDADPHPHAGVLEEVGAVGRELRHRKAVLADALARVATRPAQPDADHRKRQVVCRLDEIAGEDAETAGVDRELLREAELHAEVCDGVGHRARAR